MGQFPNRATQFPPGNCANPGGRPKGRTLTGRLRDLLEKGEINGKPIKDGKQVADLLAEVLLKEALQGDMRAIQYVFDRVDGKIPDKLQVEGKKILVEYADRRPGSDAPEAAQGPGDDPPGDEAV